MRTSIACLPKRGAFNCATYNCAVWLAALALSGLLPFSGLVACVSERSDTVTSGVRVRYLERCKPRRVEQITVEALGDYATRESSFAAIDVQGGVQTLDSLPLAARLFRLQVVTSDFRGLAITKAADEGQRFDALVLPLGEPCLSITDEPLLPAGAALSLTGEDDLLIAGGQRNESALNDVRRVRVNTSAVVRITPDLFVPRAGAAAVRTGVETWILGGTQALTEGSPAFDAFERFDSNTQALSGIGRMTMARTEHAALALANGDVLIAGGRKSQGGAALDSLERLAAGTGNAVRVRSRLPWPLANGRLLARDDGVIVVVGSSREGLLLALYDSASDSIEELNASDLASTQELVVTLPGARVALVEIDAAGATTGTLLLMLENGAVLRLERALTSFAGLTFARAESLPDGQVLLTGSRDGQATARVIDPGTLSVRALGLPALPERVLLRDDGVALLLAQDSLTLLRNDERTRYDNPGGTLLASDMSVLAFDAKGRWAREGLTLRALANGARFDLAGLSYERVEIEIEAQGDVDLLLRLEGGSERTIQVGADEVGPALCTMAHQRGATVRLVRDADQVRIQTGEEQRICRLDGLSGRILLGVRARAEGAQVTRLVVTRRP